MRGDLPVFVFLLGSALAAGACAPNQTNEICTDTATSAIVGGTPASTYPEAVLVDMLQNGQITAACSGSVIAPRVVLTAGHCVDGFNGWHIKAPFANGQTSSSTTGETYDWAENGAEQVNPNHHDLGLVYLTTPITLNAYPVLAQKPVADGSTIVNIGRIQDGVLSTASLFVSAPVAIQSAVGVGFPFDYAAGDIIQSGDSGGPDELVGARPHTIVSVNSGAGGGSEVLARVDILYAWVQQKIAAHGGGGTTAPPTADAGTGGTTHDAGTSSSGGTSIDGDAGGAGGGSDPNASGDGTLDPGGSAPHRNPCSR
jgi:hypothetical protein